MRIEFRAESETVPTLIHEGEVAPGMPLPTNRSILHFGFDRYRVSHREFQYRSDGEPLAVTIFLVNEPSKSPAPKDRGDDFQA